MESPEAKWTRNDYAGSSPAVSPGFRSFSRAGKPNQPSSLLSVLPRIRVGGDNGKLVFVNPNHHGRESPTTTQPHHEEEDTRNCWDSLLTRPIVTNDEITPAGPRRVVKGLGEHPGYAENSVRTTLFKWIFKPPGFRRALFPIDFFFRNLYAQFRHRAANCYYLLIAVLQFLSFSPYAPTNWFPLVVVLLVNMIKEVWEDWSRGTEDAVMNYSQCVLLEDEPSQQAGNGAPGVHEFLPATWGEIMVGDFVLVGDTCPLPCDIVVLAASGTNGAFFISTADLDGESNLKARNALEKTNAVVSDAFTLVRLDPRALRASGTSAGPTGAVPVGGRVNAAGMSVLKSAVLKCDRPNQHLYAFSGVLSCTLPGGEEVKVNVPPASIALRGSTVKNTQWVLGMAVYCGHDSKVYMNSTLKAEVKSTTMDVQQNKCVAIMFGFLFVICLVSSIINTIMERMSFKDVPWYFYGRASEFDNVYVSFLTGIVKWLILLSALIPISLTISLEMVRVLHKLFIEWDMAMRYRDPAKDEEIGAIARTSNLSEDLGRVDYIFSDKTGTLTCNIMELMKLGIAPGVEYGSGLTEIARLGMQERGIVVPPKRLPEGVVLEKGNGFYDERVSTEAQRLAQPNAAAIDAFFRVLMVCHTTMARRAEDPKAVGGSRIKYESESPDENALVIGAASVGYRMIERRQQFLVCQVDGVEEIYEVLTVNQFNSDRKRMSTVVRCPDGTLKLFCKGADSVILELLSDSAQNNWRRRAEGVLGRFSQGGLRTLCIAERNLDKDFYAQWSKEYHRVITSQAADRQQRLDALTSQVECGLTLLGMTGIEDKLQEGVPQTIKAVLAAAVKLWVLTGDHVETAMSIAMACGLIRSDFKLFVVSLSKEPIPGGPSAEKDFVLKQLEDGAVQAAQLAKEGMNVALAIDGAALRYALLAEKTEPKPGQTPDWSTEPGPLLRLGMHCRTVLCCRVSPMQKAEVVLSVKKKLPSIGSPPPWAQRIWPFGGLRGPTVTLAIGDGANDVEMIRAAHIGVGISGMEGRQAVNSSDYAIGQFRFVGRLLLVHGRMNCIRIGTLINYSFFKNVAFAMTNVWYGALSMFSGAKFQEDNHAMIWNVIVTAFPILVFAVLDKDIDPPEIAFSLPRLYSYGQKRLDFNAFSFSLWIVEAVIDSLILFFIPFICLYNTSPSWGEQNQGDTTGVWLPSWVSYCACVIVINLRLFLSTKLFTIYTWAVVLGSILAFIVFALVYSALGPATIHTMAGVAELSGLLFDCFDSPVFWLTLVLSITAALLYPLIGSFIEAQFYPSLAQRLRVRLHHERWLYMRRKGVGTLLRYIGIGPWRPYSREEMDQYLMRVDLKRDMAAEGVDVHEMPGALPPRSLQVISNGKTSDWRGFTYSQDPNNCPDVPVNVFDDDAWASQAPGAHGQEGILAGIIGEDPALATMRGTDSSNSRGASPVRRMLSSFAIGRDRSRSRRSPTRKVVDFALSPYENGGGSGGNSPGGGYAGAAGHVGGTSPGTMGRGLASFSTGASMSTLRSGPRSLPAGTQSLSAAMMSRGGLDSLPLSLAMMPVAGASPRAGAGGGVGSPAPPGTSDGSGGGPAGANSQRRPSGAV